MCLCASDFSLKRVKKDEKPTEGQVQLLLKMRTKHRTQLC